MKSDDEKREIRDALSCFNLSEILALYNADILDKEMVLIWLGLPS